MHNRGRRVPLDPSLRVFCWCTPPSSVTPWNASRGPKIFCCLSPIFHNTFLTSFVSLIFPPFPVSDSFVARRLQVVHVPGLCINRCRCLITSAYLWSCHPRARSHVVCRRMINHTDGHNDRRCLTDEDVSNCVSAVRLVANKSIPACPLKCQVTDTPRVWKTEQGEVIC